MTATTVRSRAIVAVVAAALVAILAPAPAHAAVDATAEASFVSLLNQERTSRGLPPVTVAADLTAVARRHSGRMGAATNLHHNPSLAADVANWKKVGENVGRGSTVASIHGAFMASAGHKANILDRDWVEIGVGVEVIDGRIWVTEVFRKPLAAPAPVAAKSPAAAPSPAATPVQPAPRPAPAKAATPEPAAVKGSAGDRAPAPAPAREARLTVDRMLVMLARLEAGDGRRSLSSLLGR